MRRALAHFACIATIGIGGCACDDLPPTAWPPEGFEFVAEELVQYGDRVDTVRKFRLTGDGIAVYGTSAQPLLSRGNDIEGEVSLPVFDRVSIYRMVPSAVRWFARRMHRVGFLSLDDALQDPELRPDATNSVVVLKWTSVNGHKRHVVRGNPRGQMAEVLRVLAAHLPAEEQFPGIDPAERAPVSVLVGVPAPAVDLRGSLAAHEQVLRERGEDPELLADTFALACRAGDRELAIDLLERWLAARAVSAPGGVADRANDPATVAVWTRMLPRH